MTCLRDHGDAEWCGCENPLGHYSAGFTLDTYTHVTNQMQYGAAQKIGNFMNEATGNVPEPEPPTTPPEAENGCKVIPFERVG